jgi:tRNA(fMet)-specific endonuclease VapC
MRYVLDTNIISFIIRTDLAVLGRFSQILEGDNLVLACPVVWYEIRRGLLAKQAAKQMEAFYELFALFRWEDLKFDDWSSAADLWALRRSVGKPIGESDLLIAAFTLNRNAILVTDNTKDFSGLNLNLENWR